MDLSNTDTPIGQKNLVRCPHFRDWGGGGGGGGVEVALGYFMLYINMFFHARVILGVGKGVLFREVSSVHCTVCIDRIYIHTGADLRQLSFQKEE